MKRRMISLVLSLAIVLSLHPFVFADVNILLTSSVYNISEADPPTINGVSANTAANVFLYYMQKDNPDYLMLLVDSSGLEASYLSIVTNTLRLKVEDKNGNVKYYKIENTGKKSFSDDFESYPLGAFYKSDTWRSTKNDGSCEITLDNENRYCAINTPASSSLVTTTETTRKCVDGVAQIEFNIKNSTPDATSFHILLRDDNSDASPGSIPLLFMSSSKLFCFYSDRANKNYIPCPEDEWIKVRIVIDTVTAKKIYVCLGEEDEPFDSIAISNSSFNWSNFVIRFINSNNQKTQSVATVGLDNFSYISDVDQIIEDNDFSVEAVNLYNNDEYVTSVINGKNVFKLRANNSTGNTKNVSVIIARKIDGILEDISVNELTVSDGTSYLTASIDVKNAVNGNLALYLWEKDTLTPLIPAVLPDTSKVERAIKNGHPRIIADDSVFKKITGYTDSLQVGWRDSVLNYADKIVSNFTTEGSYSDNNFYLGLNNMSYLAMARRMKQYVETLGMAYQLTNNQVYADKALEVLYAGDDEHLDTWYPEQFLSVAEFTAAYAIGYDWCYDAISDTDKDKLASVVYKYGIETAYKNYNGTQGSYLTWVNVNTNWNIVCNSGIMMGALAFAEYNPLICERSLDYGIKNIKNGLAELGPDGAWEEGLGYTSYILQYITQLSSSLCINFDTSYGINDTAGLEELLDFTISTFGPTGIYNFADATVNHSTSSYAFYLADVYDRSDVRSFVLDYFTDTDAVECINALLWCDDVTHVSDIQFKNSYSRKLEHITLGSGFESDGTWLSTHGGYNDADHHHLDLGSFVFDCDGVRWAMELGGDSYLDGYFDHPKSYYRTRAEGHNTLVINPTVGNDQDSDAFAKVIRYNLRDDNPFAIYDLTSAYKSSASKVYRGFMMLDNYNGVVIRDEIEADEDASIYWFMHSEATITIGDDGKSAKLTKNGKEMEIKVFGEGLELSVEKARPLSIIGEYVGDGYPDPAGQNTNPRATKLMIKKTGGGNITVCIAKNGYTISNDTNNLDSWN